MAARLADLVRYHAPSDLCLLAACLNTPALMEHPQEPYDLADAPSVWRCLPFVMTYADFRLDLEQNRDLALSGRWSIGLEVQGGFHNTST